MTHAGADSEHGAQDKAAALQARLEAESGADIRKLQARLEAATTAARAAMQEFFIAARLSGNRIAPYEGMDTAPEAIQELDVALGNAFALTDHITSEAADVFGDDEDET